MSARRTSLTTSRRRSSGAPRLLGAVKLQSPLAGSDAGSPSSSSEPASAVVTPQDRSPLVVARGAEAPQPDAGHVSAAAADNVARFSRQLSSSRSSDRWLEEQEKRASAKGGAPRRQAPPAGASPAVETAASQIVHKALRFITAENSPGGVPGKVAAPPAARRTSSGAFDSATFLDKGMDAISGVGRLMEGFAITLDTVIGQAFEDWGSSANPGSSSKSAALRRAPQPGRPAAADSWLDAPRLRASSQPAPADKENGGGNSAGVATGAAGAAAKPRQQQAGAGGGATTSGRQAHMTSFMSKLDAASEQEVAEWRKRAQQLASELQRVRAQQEEYQRLRLQYDKLQADLQQASTQASQLAQENSALKSTPTLPPGMDPALADPLAAQQVACQMEALLAEKSKLVQENDRLLRENTGLQELLEFTLAHQSQLAADGDLFGYEEDEGCLLDGGEEGTAAALGEAVPGDAQPGGMGEAVPASV